MRYIFGIFLFVSVVFAWPTFENTKPKDSVQSDKITDESKQKTPLHKAIEDNVSIFDIIDLVNKGADINAVDKYGDTPLHYSAKYNNQDAISLLLEHGANPKGQNYIGKTPMDIAIEYAHLEAFDILLQYVRDDRWINE